MFAQVVAVPMLGPPHSVERASKHAQIGAYCGIWLFAAARFPVPLRADANL
jgi:hypothetical protein